MMRIIDKVTEFNRAACWGPAPLPAGTKLLGVVVTDYDKGLLLQYEATGIYVQAVCGAVKPLNQSDVKAILKGRAE